MPLLPPVIATLLADTKEYMAKMREAEHQMGKFGHSAEVAGGKFHKFAGSAATAITATGTAMIAYGVESALKFNEALDKIQNQAGASSSEIEFLKNAILKTSNQTAISSENIADAFLQVEKAGIRGSKAYALVSDAAKAAAITGGDVSSIAKTIVGVQELQITKGMSLAQVTDMLVIANQKHVGSLDQITAALTGRVGGALAAAHVSLAELAAVSDVASKAGYNQSRVFVQLATGLNKLESPTSATTKSMAKLGLNAQTLASIARHPGTGLIDVLGYLEQYSKRTGTAMNTLIQGTFGASSIGLVTDLTNHLNELKGTVKTLGGASGAGLASAFGITQKQLNFQLEQLKTQAENALKGIGLLLLPTVGDIAKFAESAVSYFGKHPLVKSIVSDTALTLFAASFAFKLTSALGKIPFLGDALKAIPGLGKLFGATKGVITAEQGASQIALLTAIADNTAIMAGEGGISGTGLGEVGSAGLGAGAGGTEAVAGAALGLTAAGVVAAGIGTFALGYELTKGNNRDVTAALVKQFYKGPAAAQIMKQISQQSAWGQQFVIDDKTGQIYAGGGRGRMVSGWTPQTGVAEQTWAMGHNITKTTKHTVRVKVTR